MGAERLRVGSDGVTRCWWCGDDPFYMQYHDDEWGHPVTADVRLFEKLCLEGFQSGLSWLTILRKRENFRAAFAGFDIDTVATLPDSADYVVWRKTVGSGTHHRPIDHRVHVLGAARDRVDPGDAARNFAGNRRGIGEARGIEREVHRAKLEQKVNSANPGDWRASSASDLLSG